jgi:hypothetical protein
LAVFVVPEDVLALIPTVHHACRAVGLAKADDTLPQDTRCAACARPLPTRTGSVNSENFFDDAGVGELRGLLRLYAGSGLTPGPALSRIRRKAEVCERDQQPTKLMDMTTPIIVALVLATSVLTSVCTCFVMMRARPGHTMMAQQGQASANQR